MSDKERQQILEEQGDEFLQELFNQAAEEKAEALWKAYQAEVEAGTAPEMPEELDAKCRELISASEKKQTKGRVRKFVGIGLKNAAIVVLVLLVLTSTAVMSVDAIKVPVMNFFVRDGGRYSAVTFGMEQPKEESKSLIEKVTSVRLPSGYLLESVQQKDNGGFTCRFVNHNGEVIQVIVMPSDSMIDLDTEDAEQEGTTVYEWPAVYIRKNGHRIVWFNSEIDYVYDTYATDLSEPEFWKYVFRIAK